MRYIALIVLLLLLSACGGSGRVTLHGTFSDTESASGLAGSGDNCDTWETSTVPDNAPSESWTVAVAVDNIPAGTVAVSWQGKPITLFNEAECVGTWTLTVPAAHIGYNVSVQGVGGSVTVSTADSGEAISLSYDGTSL
jgi:hypothetical protein